MSVLETLLSDLPTGWRVTDVYVGLNWVLSLVNHADGRQRAGVASTPRQIAPDSRFQTGHYALNEASNAIAQLLRSEDATAAAVGLATINALNRHDEANLTSFDAADWLAAQSTNRQVAFFGRFPFIEDEIRPQAQDVWIFEQDRAAGEYDMADVATLLPKADVIAITGSTIINHTIDLILPHIRPGSLVVLLGPSTPLTEKLFRSGIDAMFGVLVEDVQQAVESVIAGDGFQKMRGLRRVSLCKAPA